MKHRWFVIVSVLLFIFFFLPVSTVFAHLMLIEPVEEGKIRVAFDNGSANLYAEVAVYNEDGDEIGRGGVDSKGYFTYSAEGAILLVAEDRFGHRAEFTVGENVREQLPRIPVIGGVLVGFALIAGVFQYRVKQRESDG
jgi:nickel transport protein